MNQKQSEVSYDQFFLKSFNERRNIFNEITAENRAFLVKTHAERWLAANRSRLSDEQISLVGKVNQLISPELYKTKQDFSDEIDPEIEELIQKLEAVFSREDIRQLATNHAEYIPIIEIQDN